MSRSGSLVSFVFLPGAMLLSSLSTRAVGAEPTTRPTLWLIGDSTVKNGTSGEKGWGEVLGDRFDATKIEVLNKAIGGRSSRTFLTDGRWDEILKTLKAGDYVMMQFGHNDPAPLSGDNRERGTIRGIGDEQQDVTLTLGANTGKTEVVHTYGWYLRKYVTDTKAKGATPIVISYIPRCPQPDGKVEVPSEPATYALWAQQVAESEHASFLDLNRRIWQKWVDDKMPPALIKTSQFTDADFTHTSPAGANFNADRVVDGVRALDIPLKETLR